MSRIPLIIIVVAIASAAALGAQAPSIRIAAPDGQTILAGVVTFAADVRPPGTAIVEVKFYVDGAEACSARVPPFRCAADVGMSVGARSIRAVAQLKDGTRIAAAIRTKGVEVSEAVSVDAVIVSAHVTDYRDRFVSGLKRDDFRVFEDGVAQEITSFNGLDGPVDIVVALDVSGSMAPTFTAFKEAVIQFLGAMRPQDAVTVAGFNTGLFVAAPQTASGPERDAAIRRMRSWGGTALYDAMIRACDLLRRPANRKALVVFSDGDDVSSRGSTDAARAALQSADAVLYVVGQGRAATDRVLRERLQTLAAETGGLAFFGTTPSDLSGYFDAVIENLTHQYSFGYVPQSPPGDGKWRNIRVELTGRRHTVRARRGYFATPPKGGSDQP